MKLHDFVRAFFRCVHQRIHAVLIKQSNSNTCRLCTCCSVQVSLSFPLLVLVWIPKDSNRSERSSLIHISVVNPEYVARHILSSWTIFFSSGLLFNMCGVKNSHFIMGYFIMSYWLSVRKCFCVCVPTNRKTKEKSKIIDYIPWTWLYKRIKLKKVSLKAQRYFRLTIRL